MKERGMIFNAEMVRAILDGRKTQTRRIMAPQPADDIERCIFPNPEAIGWKSSLRHKHGSTTAHFCHYGKPGDRIWVRETWNKYGGLLTYRADHDWIDDMRKETVCTAKWVPSIHMPRWASRILLEITDVRVERLNSISQEDAQAEGLELTGWRPTYSDPDSGGEVMTPYDNFAELWSSIYGDESWQANPWVWVIEFKRVEGGAA
ncbi:TPA: morphogenetic protein [Klebsiella pneumoniae]